MQLTLILAAIYIIVMPIIFRLVAFTHKKLVTQRAMQKAGNNRNQQAKVPKPIWGIWKERITFTMKDKRDAQIGKKQVNLQNRQMFFLIWGIGLATVVLGAFLENWKIYIPSYFIFFFATGFGISASKDILEKREKMFRRMFEIAQSKMGLSSEFSENPQQAIRVLEWADPLKPNKVQFDVPTTFGQEGEEGFLRQFNQVFGNETAWVPFDDAENGVPGWNYEEGTATFRAVPPLPTIAPWDEHYVIGEGVAWSFFPIALGVENGVALPNPQTGEVENVLGFDLSGEQTKIGKKAGLTVGPEITTSPMCLTGDTKVVLADNSTITLKDMSDSNISEFLVKSNENGIIKNNIMRSVIKTRSNAETLIIELDDGGIIKSTYDHLIYTDKGYVEAQDLKNFDKVFCLNGKYSTVINISKGEIVDVYDGEVDNAHNFFVKTEGHLDNAVQVHNCFIGGGTGGGKSLSVDTLVEIINKKQ